MFYRFQANELAKEWAKLVTISNEQSLEQIDESRLLNALEVGLKLAIKKEQITPLSKDGFPIESEKYDLRECFVDLQDFCNWGQTFPNSGIPKDEFELAYMLGIQEMDEHTEPLRISQPHQPPTQQFKEISDLVRNTPLGEKLLGKIDTAALTVTPPITVFKASALDDLNDLSDGARRLKKLRFIGGEATKRHGQWKFTKISELIEMEKAEGRKRVSEKTIRKDLAEAAYAEERMKRNAGQ
jgi:hypothetical protein